MMTHKLKYALITLAFVSLLIYLSATRLFTFNKLGFNEPDFSKLCLAS